MLKDCVEALEQWPPDDKLETIQIGAIEKHLLNSISQNIDELDNYFKKSEYLDYKYFDQTYRILRCVSGFGLFIKSQKITHLGMLGELIADAARLAGGYSQNSKQYLMKIVIAKLQQVTDEFLRKSETNQDLSEIVNECSLYLAEPINALLTQDIFNGQFFNAESNNEINVNEQRENLGLVQKNNLDLIENSSSEQTTHEEHDEVLSIPIDKVGLISDFCEEAWENLQTSENLLIELENNPTSVELVNELFRSIHTIKGGSRLIEIKKIERLSHELENVLDDVRSQKRKLDVEIIDIALNCVNTIKLITDEVAYRGPIKTKVNHLIHRLKFGSSFNNPVKDEKQIINVDTAAQHSVAHQEYNSNIVQTSSNRARDEAIKVSSDKLDSVLNTAAEVYINRIRLDNDNKLLKATLAQAYIELQRIKENSEIFTYHKPPHQGVSVLKSQKEFFTLENTYSNVTLGNTNIDNSLNSLSLILDRARIQSDDLQQNIDELQVLSSRLQSGAMNFRMVPINQLFSRFPAQVRDIARQIGKKVELKLSGGETELDKIIINQLGDPLIHILRNSIDHGIENRELREQTSKSNVGRINLRAYYSGSNAVVEIEDDGKGIDSRLILNKAIEKGLVKKDQAKDLGERDILDLIFEPGFSSADKVTELSGRGVGMDVVKTAVHQMQGSITIDSKLGKGTKISLKLPLTLAVIGILLVSENEKEFAFPILNIEEVVRINIKKDLVFHKNRFTFDFRGQLIKVVSLSDILDFRKRQTLLENQFLVILNDGENKIGVIVDEVKGQQNVLLKQTGNLIVKAPFVMGCTILSNSKLVLILNVLEISNVTETSEKNEVGTKVKIKTEIENQRLLKNIMVIDDSQMQRKRISEFLISGGYRIDEAEDGFQALKLCEIKSVDAFLVDLQMPVMDGFQFISSVRKIPKYRNAVLFVISGAQKNRDGVFAALKEFDVKNYFEKPVNLEEMISELDAQLITFRSQIESGGDLEKS